LPSLKSGHVPGTRNEIKKTTNLRGLTHNGDCTWGDFFQPLYVPHVLVEARNNLRS
jgi:hypothetical protein